MLLCSNKQNKNLVFLDKDCHMPTLNAIIKEMKEVPDESLEDVYQFIHSLNPKFKSSLILKKKILSFAGSFAAMSSKDYAGFLKETRKTRSKLFSRNVEL